MILFILGLFYVANADQDIFAWGNTGIGAPTDGAEAAATILK